MNKPAVVHVARERRRERGGEEEEGESERERRGEAVRYIARV